MHGFLRTKQQHYIDIFTWFLENEESIIASSQRKRKRNIKTKVHHRINTFYLSLDNVLSEIKSRFDNNDQEILCALGDVVLNDSPLENSFDVVADIYNVDKDLLEGKSRRICIKIHHG